MSPTTSPPVSPTARATSSGQHSPLPTHLGAYPDCVRGVLEFYDVEDLREGDCFLTNHPYHSGCPHPSDMVVVMPVFAGDDVIAFCASMGHKVDIGGQSPGSRNAIARDLFGEGLSILTGAVHAPARAAQGGRPSSCAPTPARRNSCWGTSRRRRAPLWSIGVRRLNHTVETYGKEAVLDAFKGIGDRTEVTCPTGHRDVAGRYGGGRGIHRRRRQPHRDDPHPRRGHQGGRPARHGLQRHGRPVAGPRERSPALRARHGELRRDSDDGLRHARTITASRVPSNADSGRAASSARSSPRPWASIP